MEEARKGTLKVEAGKDRESLSGVSSMANGSRYSVNGHNIVKEVPLENEAILPSVYFVSSHRLEAFIANSCNNFVVRVLQTKWSALQGGPDNFARGISVASALGRK